MRRPRGGPPTSLRAYAAAKVNVGWAVGPLRPDGFHDVNGCIQTISLFDRLDVRTHARPEDVAAGTVCAVGGVPVALTVDGPESEAVPADERNLVVAAAVRLAEEVTPLPTTITLTKAIPVAAGLGGGSADAAAAITALGLAWAADLTARDLLERGASVGSDVPAILIGGLVHASGRGERVRNIGSASGGVFVLGLAHGGLSTAEVYGRLDELRATSPDAPRRFESNDLERAAVSLAAGLGDDLAAVRDAAGVAFLAGSGPTVAAVVADHAEAARVVAAIEGRFRAVVVAEPSTWGVRLALGAGP